MAHTATISLDLEHPVPMPNGETWFIAPDCTLDVDYSYDRKGDRSVGWLPGVYDLELSGADVPLTLIDAEGERTAHIIVRWNDPIIDSLFKQHGDYFIDACDADFHN